MNSTARQLLFACQRLTSPEWNLRKREARQRHSDPASRHFGTSVPVCLFEMSKTQAEHSTGEAITIHGQAIDSQTRCLHWDTERDVVALQFYCCKKFYPCSLCHDEDSKGNHETKRWPKEQWAEKAVFCGCCKALLSIATYVALYEGGGAVECPSCFAHFNPGCRGHLDIYFDMGKS